MFRRITKEQYEKAQKERDKFAEISASKQVFFDSMEKTLDELVTSRCKEESAEISQKNLRE